MCEGVKEVTHSMRRVGTKDQRVLRSDDGHTEVSHGNVRDEVCAKCGRTSYAIRFTTGDIPVKHNHKLAGVQGNKDPQR